MATEVLQDSTTTTVELYPDTHAPASTPQSATVAVFDAGGGSLATGSATVDATDTTVVSASTVQSIVLASVSGLAVGRSYRLAQSTGAVAVVKVETIDTATDTITIAEPPGFTPATGDTFEGVRVSYTLTAGATKDRAVNFSVLWTVDQGGHGTYTHRTVFHVCRTLFKDQITSSTVFQYVAENHPSAAQSMTLQRRQQLADRANGLVRARLLETQRYPHLVADQNSFSEAARIALQYVLMDERLMLPGDEGLLASLTELDRRLDRETTRALDSMVWVDNDDDNVVDTGEVAPISIRMVM